MVKPSPSVIGIFRARCYIQHFEKGKCYMGDDKDKTPTRVSAFDVEKRNKILMRQRIS